MSNTITTNPLFVDQVSANFRLTSASPAIDAALGTPVSTEDMDLIQRSQFGVPDLGAYEYTGSPAQTGLRGTYHATSSFTSPVVYTRDEALAHGWGSRAPAPGATANNCYVYWYGYITPPSTGTYSFRARTSNGLKRSIDEVLNQNATSLWINNQLAVSTWYNNPNVTVSAGIPMTAGQRYPIAVEFRSAAGDASLFLDWKTPGESVFMVVPKGRLSPN
jgi:hypothetical protein